MVVRDIGAGPHLVPDASETGGARRAALLLHALAPADRAWMLDALPPREREGLNGLLVELEALGIARDPTLVAEVVCDDGDTSPALTPDAQMKKHVPLTGEALLHALDGSQVDRLMRCLRTEPAGLIAECLRLADWPWHSDVLAALEPAQKRRVEAQLSMMDARSSTPPGMRAALIAGLLARLQGSPAAQADFTATPWHRLKRSVARIVPNGWARWGTAP